MIPSSLVLLPVLLLILPTLAILILRRLWSGFGFSWLVAITGSSLAWFSLLALRFQMPIRLELADWIPQGLFNSSPEVWLDEISWSYAFSLITLVVAAILTATARYHHQTSPSAWAGSLGITAIGVLTVLAANPLTLLLLWTALDLVELIVFLNHASDSRGSSRTVIAFAARVAGSMLVLWSVVAYQPSGIAADFSSFSSSMGLFFLLGIGLRLGVFPLHLPFAQEPPLRRGLGSILRIVPAASSLGILARLPGDMITPEHIPILLVLAALAAIFSSLLWVFALDELNARPYWIISLAALAITCVLRGYPQSSIAWGIALILTGGFIFLFSARNRRMQLLLIITFWGISGLPFSPAASGWQGLMGSPLPGLNLIFLITVVLLLTGALHHSLRPGDSLSGTERWVLITYPMGLILVLLVHLGLGYAGWPGSRTVGLWWASGIVLALTLLGIYVYWSRFSPLRLEFIDNHKRRPFGLSIWVRSLAGAFRLEWFYQSLWVIYRGVGRAIGGVTIILEGSGGVLWALLLLILLFTLLQTGRIP